MAHIDAFVGHSFTEDDGPLTDAFLRYFRSLNPLLSFDWVDAVGARPVRVSSKVMELFSGKNAFIGICTKREYAHSNLGHSELALLHYLKIPDNIRSDAAWNNLGVAYGELWIKARGVNAFRRSADVGSTLAMANLARKYVAAGFLDEARQMFDRGRAVEGYDAAIDEGLANLHEVVEEEKEKESKARLQAAPLSSFLSRFANGLLASGTADFDGHWTGPECTFSFSLEDGELKGFGEYESPPLLNALGGLFSASLARSSKTQITIIGKVRGMAAYGQVTRDGPMSPAISLLSGKSTNVLLLATGERIEVMETGHNARIYALERVNPASDP